MIPETLNRRDVVGGWDAERAGDRSLFLTFQAG